MNYLLDLEVVFEDPGDDAAAPVLPAATARPAGRQAMVRCKAWVHARALEAM